LAGVKDKKGRKIFKASDFLALSIKLEGIKHFQYGAKNNDKLAEN
jgi:hypothetical protein